MQGTNYLDKGGGEHDPGTLNAPFSVGYSSGGSGGGGSGDDEGEEDDVYPDGEPVSIPKDGKMKFESGVELDLSDIMIAACCRRKSNCN